MDAPEKLISLQKLSGHVRPFNYFESNKQICVAPSGKEFVINLIKDMSNLLWKGIVFYKVRDQEPANLLKQHSYPSILIELNIE